MNANQRKPTDYDLAVARNAQGKSIFEARLDHPLLSREEIEALYWNDPITGLWFHRDIVLFRPKEKAA